MLHHREISHSLSNISEGVVITDNLSWSSHIESTCRKAKMQLRLIHRDFHQASRVACERLYKLIVLPHLDYRACVWDPYQAKYKEKLNSVQGFASKLVLQNWTAPWQQSFLILKWPCLEDWHKVQKLIMCSKIINGQPCSAPSTFSQHLTQQYYCILIDFLCLHHRLIQLLIDLFLYLLYLCGTLCPQLFHLHLQLLPLSLMVICILSLFTYSYVLLYSFVFGEALE